MQLLSYDGQQIKKEIHKNSKAYWSPLKSLLNSNKISIAVPILHKDAFVTNVFNNNRKQNFSSVTLPIKVL